MNSGWTYKQPLTKTTRKTKVNFSAFLLFKHISLVIFERRAQKWIKSNNLIVFTSLEHWF